MIAIFCAKRFVHSFQWSRMTRDGQGIRAYQMVKHGITLRPIDCTELPSGSADSLLFAKEFLEKQDTYSWKSQTLIPGKARH